MASGAPASGSQDFGYLIGNTELRSTANGSTQSALKRTWVNFQFLPVPITLFSSSLVDRLR